MIDKRHFLALPAAALLVACGGDTADDTVAAPGEVLDGTISDAMLPLDRVRSEAPLEDPDAFVAAQAGAGPTSGGPAGSDPTDEADTPGDAGTGDEEAAAAEPTGVE